MANAVLLDELSDNQRAWWPDDPSRPFRLLCRRHIGALNSSGRDLPRMARTPFNPAFMHPDDLTQLGLVPGDLVEISSAAGAVCAVVDADPALRRGIVSMTHGFGDGQASADASHYRTQGANLNALLRVDDDYDRITGMPHMSNVAVSVTAVAT